MSDTNYDFPYIYLLEFHIGDGYFDRQPNGEYSVLVNYRNETNLVIKERERGDDRLVKFRQGKSVIFGIANPQLEMQVKFLAYDNNEEIGKSSIYFLGIGSPSTLAVKSKRTPSASLIRTNLQLSHGAGSLQVFARLTCFGHTLLTDFSVSAELNTQFETYVNDTEISAEESFTRYNFDVGPVKISKASNAPADNKADGENLLAGETLKPTVSNFHIFDDQTSNLESLDGSLGDEKKDQMSRYMSQLLDKAAEKVGLNITEPKPIRNLDDLMFTNFDGEELTEDATNYSVFSLSADNSVLDLKDYDDRSKSKLEDTKIDEKEEELKHCSDGKCVELKIGDAPLSGDVTAEEPQKSEEKLETIDENISEEVPSETGDAPPDCSIGGEADNKEEDKKLDDQSSVAADDSRLDGKTSEERCGAEIDGIAKPTVERSKRKIAKGKRRRNKENT